MILVCIQAGDAGQVPGSGVIGGTDHTTNARDPKTIDNDSSDPSNKDPGSSNGNQPDNSSEKKPEAPVDDGLDAPDDPVKTDEESDGGNKDSGKDAAPSDNEGNNNQDREFIDPKVASPQDAPGISIDRLDVDNKQDTEGTRTFRDDKPKPGDGVSNSENSYADGLPSSKLPESSFHDNQKPDSPNFGQGETNMPSADETRTSGDESSSTNAEREQDDGETSQPNNNKKNSGKPMSDSDDENINKGISPGSESTKTDSTVNKSHEIDINNKENKNTRTSNNDSANKNKGKNQGSEVSKSEGTAGNSKENGINNKGNKDTDTSINVSTNENSNKDINSGSDGSKIDGTVNISDEAELDGNRDTNVENKGDRTPATDSRSVINDDKNAKENPNNSHKSENTDTGMAQGDEVTKNDPNSDVDDSEKDLGIDVISSKTDHSIGNVDTGKNQGTDGLSNERESGAQPSVVSSTEANKDDGKIPDSNNSGDSHGTDDSKNNKPDQGYGNVPHKNENLPSSNSDGVLNNVEKENTDSINSESEPTNSVTNKQKGNTEPENPVYTANESNDSDNDKEKGGPGSAVAKDKTAEDDAKSSKGKKDASSSDKDAHSSKTKPNDNKEKEGPLESIVPVSGEPLKTVAIAVSESKSKTINNVNNHLDKNRFDFEDDIHIEPVNDIIQTVVMVQTGNRVKASNFDKCYVE